MTDFFKLPAAVPVMPLPGALLFPHALLPLYIFEQRYRAMLEHALAHHRMFCVSLVDPDLTEWNSVDDFSHVATVGLVRACVARGDGTSNLILQGLQRVRFTSFEQEDPFPIAQITPLVSNAATVVETDALSTKLLDLYATFKRQGRQFPEKVDEHFARLDDPEMLADLMAATFVSDPARRQRLLEELSIAERLRLVIQYLREESGGSAA